MGLGLLIYCELSLDFEIAADWCSWGGMIVSQIYSIGGFICKPFLFPIYTHKLTWFFAFSVKFKSSYKFCIRNKMKSSIASPHAIFSLWFILILHGWKLCMEAAVAFARAFFYCIVWRHFFIGTKSCFIYKLLNLFLILKCQNI